jgi:hypothetical protein
MNEKTRKQLERVKALIERERYQQALTLLAEIDHPTADKWVAKLKKRQSLSSDKQKIKHRQNVHRQIRRARSLIGKRKWEQQNHPDEPVMVTVYTGCISLKSHPLAVNTTMKSGDGVGQVFASIKRLVYRYKAGQGDERFQNWQPLAE